MIDIVNSSFIFLSFPAPIGEGHDDGGDQVFVPENRLVKKTYSTVNEIMHPKKILRDESQIKVEFDEYNETTKSLVTQYMIGNISTEVLKANLSSFIINDQAIVLKRHHADVEEKVTTEADSEDEAEPELTPGPAIALPRLTSRTTSAPLKPVTQHPAATEEEPMYTSGGGGGLLPKSEYFYYLIVCHLDRATTIVYSH